MFSTTKQKYSFLQYVWHAFLDLTELSFSLNKLSLSFQGAVMKV